MKRILLATVFTVVAAPAFAWTCPDGTTVCSAADSGSAAASQSISHSAATARNISRITVSPTINVAAPSVTSSPSLVAAPSAAVSAPASQSGTGSSGAAGDPAADPSSTHHAWHGHSGGSSQTLVQQFPPASAYAAPLAGGPCNGSGSSGGAQTAWFGVSFAHQRFDYGCAGERMGDLMTVGQRLDWAYQCQDNDKFRKASASIGLPCPGDEQRRQAVAPAATPVATHTPAPAKPPVDAVLHGTANIYGYCYGTMTNAEKRRHPECGL